MDQQQRHPALAALHDLARRLRRDGEFNRGQLRYCRPLHPHDDRCDVIEERADQYDQAADMVDTVATELAREESRLGDDGL